MKLRTGFILFLLIAAPAFAAELSSLHPVAIKSLTDKTKIPTVAQIERSIVLENNFEGGRLSIVEADNGGSTDVSSTMVPSEIYLTWYMDGESVNLAAVFDLGGVKTLRGAKKTGANAYVVDGIFKEEGKGEVAGKISVNVAGLRKAIDNLKNETLQEFTTKYLDAEIKARGIR